MRCHTLWAKATFAFWINVPSYGKKSSAKIAAKFIMMKTPGKSKMQSILMHLLP